MIQACLFDIGNVLVTFDYRRTFPRLAARTARSYDEIRGHVADTSPELETGRMDSAAFVAGAMEFIGGGVSSNEFMEAFTQIFEPVRHVWEMVESVRQKVPVYLFSNTSEIHESFLFRQYPEFSRFHGGFFSWRIGSMKPDPGMYERAIADLKLPPESIAYIDDLPANIETGRRFGFRSHLYQLNEHESLAAFMADCGLTSPNGP